MDFQNLIKEEEVIKITKELIETEGHKAIESKESKVADYIKNLLEKEGITSELKEIEKNRPNVYGKIEGQSDDIELMFNGHTDTIPGFTMDYEPFKPFIKDGKIYGRGSADMKGGIAAMLSALIAIKREGVKLNKTVMFAGVIGEEERSKGTEQLIKDKVETKYIVIGEPTQLRVSVAHKGMEWIEVEFKGKATHGSRPHEGKNAIYMASKFCTLISEELQDEIESRDFELLGSGTINVGVIKGGDDPNVVPGSCSVQIDRRWLPNETLESIHKEIEDVAKRAAEQYGGDYEIRSMREFTASMVNAPYSLDIEDKLVQDALEIVKEVTGSGKPARDFPAWSDAGLISNHTNAKSIILGPGNINQAHANDEFSPVEEILNCAEIYYKLIKKLCI